MQMTLRAFRLLSLPCAVAAVALASTACIPDDDLANPEGNQGSAEDGQLIVQDGQRSIASESAAREVAGAAEVAAAATCTITVSAPQQLMITDLSVVNDAVRTRWTGGLTNASDGAWQFGRLMTQMAGANDPEAFVRTWLGQWQSAVTVSGQVVPPRTAISTIINAWPKTTAGKLDLTKAPLRLLAIVNRFDLRLPGNAGEGRFVFGVLDGAGNPLQFTVILEYKMLAATAADVKVWANLWKDLSTSPLGSAAHRTKLQAITDRFTARNAGPGRPNGSSISQVRTNEVALAFPWELREFRLTTSGQLRMAPVALTPANTTPNFDNTATLATFLTQNSAAIKAQTHQVPLQFNAAPFEGARVVNNIDFWKAPGITDSQLRHSFSLNTCNGCHGRETNTVFLHVRPRAAGAVAGLSGLLTGVTVTDPVTNVARTFNELASRATILKNFLCANP
jgi:hypothetical protein